MRLGDKEKRLIVRGGGAYFLLLLGVVSAARFGLLPGAGEVGAADGLFAHPYRLTMAMSGFVLAAWLGTASAVVGAATRKLWLGLTLLGAGGAAALLASAIAPAILYPSDRYPVAFAWMVGGFPVACATWLATTIGASAAPRPAERVSA